MPFRFQRFVLSASLFQFAFDETSSAEKRGSKLGRIKGAVILLLFVVMSSAAYAETPVQNTLQTGQSGYFLCEKDSDCRSLGESYRCVTQKYDCGPADTCGERVCLPQGDKKSSESSQAETDPGHERAARPAFKGYELYSWKDGDDWKFSLLVGTNRYKTADEIRKGTPITGVDALKERLGRLAVREWVFWFNVGAEGLTFPPAATVSELKKFASDKGINLSLASWLKAT